MKTELKLPVLFWAVMFPLLLWEIMGCFACAMQIAYGAAAMGPVDDWSLNYYAALPAWYNWLYIVATGGGLLGGVALILRDRRALYFFWISLAAVIAMFSFAFAATDLIAHKGLDRVLPFPLFITAVGAFSIWFAEFAAKKGWIGHRESL